jgi:hypothetical protein
MYNLYVLIKIKIFIGEYMKNLWDISGLLQFSMFNIVTSDFYCLVLPFYAWDPVPQTVLLSAVTTGSNLSARTWSISSHKSMTLLKRVLLWWCFGIYEKYLKYLRFHLILIGDFYYIINKLIILITDSY